MHPSSEQSHTTWGKTLGEERHCTTYHPRNEYGTLNSTLGSFFFWGGGGEDLRRYSFRGNLTFSIILAII